MSNSENVEHEAKSALSNKGSTANANSGRVGPMLTVAMVGLLVLQTLTVNPASFFREEIQNQLSNLWFASYDTSAEDNDDNLRDPALVFERGLPLSKSSSTVELWHPPERMHEKHLYRPSFAVSVKKITPVLPNSTSSIVNRTCDAVPSGMAFTTNWTSDALVSLSQFMLIDDDPIVLPSSISNNFPNSSGTWASCRFMDYQYAHQTPHFAQQMYRCWSFWKQYPDKTPVLVTTEPSHWQLTMSKEFNQGLVTSFQSLGVQLVHPSQILARRRMRSLQHQIEQSVSASTIGPIMGQNDNHFQATSVEDMRSMRREVLATLDFPHTIPTSFCHHEFPRIGIVNQKKLLRIRNYYDIVQSLTDRFNLSSKIPVVQLEGADFRPQAAMHANVDILISSHGPQAASIAFMPQCGGVLELLPESYYFPKFYGTLAATAGLNYAFLYMAQNASDRSFNPVGLDTAYFCPSQDVLGGAIAQLVDQWQSCCETVRRETGRHR